MASISTGGLLLLVGIVNIGLYGGKYATAITFNGYNDIFCFYDVY